MPKKEKILNFIREIRVARYSPRCTVLGPGVRGVLWVQGCERRCPGCVAPETWNVAGGELLDVGFLADFFTRNPSAEGVTFSGGEPFLQAEALAELVDSVRKKRPDFTFMAYTGFTLEELMAEERHERLELLARLDILIDGPYVQEEHENLLWRGSRNQRVWFLTPRYESPWRERIYTVGVHLELEMNEDTFHCMGILPQGFRKVLEKPF